MKDPRKLFMLDGFGALLSAFLLGVVLVELKHFIGVPIRTLYILASIPVLFVVYDLICYFTVHERYPSFLRYIAFANILYCIFSIAMMINHADTLTTLGWVYFINEIIIVGLVVFVELKVVAKIRA